MTAPAADGPQSLLARLMAVVRAEFRSQTLIFEPDDPVFGGGPCRVSGCERHARGHGLCLNHRVRWAKQGRLDLEEFITRADPRLQHHPRASHPTGQEPATHAEAGDGQSSTCPELHHRHCRPPIDAAQSMCATSCRTAQLLLLEPASDILRSDPSYRVGRTLGPVAAQPRS